MSAASRFVVSTTFHGNRQVKTWNSKEPMTLGRTSEGPLWVLEQTKAGQIRVRSLAPQEGEVVNAHSQILTPEQIRRGVQVKFKKKQEEIAVEIRAIERLHPKVYRHSKDADLTKGFTVYQVVGDYNTQFEKRKAEYRAKLYGENLFRITTQGNKAKIEPAKKGLVLEVNGSVQSLDSLQELDLTADEFFKATIRFGYTSWYFAAVTDARRDTIFETVETTEDTRHFRKIALSAMLLLFLFFGGSALIPKKKQEEIIPPQIVKVLVKKKEPKPAAKKLEIPGEKKEQAEKALATSEEVSPVKPNELIIPKGDQAKKLDTKQVKRINKVQNLYSGIMKGGLTKILNNQSILNSAKLGTNSNLTKINPNTTLTAAMSNLKVDLSAGGTGETKIAGFGGNSNAGVKGQAAIGYSDGVKGVTMSGTGGNKISLGTADADVEEGLTKEEVGKVIHAHMKEVRYCYENTMVRASRVDGKVILDFTINGKGRVAKVADRKPAANAIDPALGECIMRRLKTWQFPFPKGGVTVDVSYPFIFKTLGGE